MDVMSGPGEIEVPGELLEPEPETDVETAWRREVASRMTALEAGDMETTPWEEIRCRFLARLGERRPG